MESSKLHIPHSATLISLLYRAATQQPTNGLIFHSNVSHISSDKLSYEDLWKIAMKNAAFLRHHGVVKLGRPILLYFEQYRASVIWYWSVVAAGGIPALLPPARGDEKAWKRELDHICQVFDHPRILTSAPSADRFLSHGGFAVTDAEQFLVEVDQIDNILDARAESLDWMIGIKAHDVCTILFTSGTTGHSKAVQFTHQQLLASSRLKCFQNKMTSQDRFLCWTSFDHSVALCELHLHAMEAGANLFMIPADHFTEEPRRFWEVLSGKRISYTFAPNSFLAAALKTRHVADKQDGPAPPYDFGALRVLFCGGEANRTMTLKAAADFLSSYGAPQNAVTAVYGLSETCSALFYNRNGPSYDVQRNYTFASVGVSLPEHEVRLVKREGLSAEMGAVQIRGPMIFQGYYNNTEATASCILPDGWFDTGDLGYLNDQNDLVISGRSKDILVLNGQNYSCGELEYAIETSITGGLESGYTVCFSIWSDASDSEEPVVLFNPLRDETSDSPRLREIVSQIIQAVAGFCRKRPSLVVPLPKSRLPRNSIGKLSRAKLRSSLLAGEFDEFKLLSTSNGSNLGQLMTPNQRTIARVFVDCLNVPEADISADLSVEDLNIDSLTYLRIRFGIEQAFPTAKPISVPQLASCHNIGDIERMLTTPETASSVPYNPIKVLRAAGSRTPLILCPPGHGGFLNYMGIYPLIRDRKIFALHASGMEPDQEPFTTMDQMLDVYTAAIKQHQPSGPYALFGFCYGGILSFELCKRLEALGDKVIFCGGLDSPLDVSALKADVDERYQLSVILESLGLLRLANVPNIMDRLAHVPKEKIVEEGVSLLPRHALDSVGLSMASLQSWVKMSQHMSHLAFSYQASGLVKTYDAFYAAKPPADARVDDPAAWRYVYIGEWKNHVVGASNQDLCLEYSGKEFTSPVDRPLRMHCVTGSHETMTTRSNMESLGQRINGALLLREEEWARQRAMV